MLLPQLVLATLAWCSLEDGSSVAASPRQRVPADDGNERDAVLNFMASAWIRPTGNETWLKMAIEVRLDGLPPNVERTPATVTRKDASGLRDGGGGGGGSSKTVTPKPNEVPHQSKDNNNNNRTTGSLNPILQRTSKEPRPATHKTNVTRRPLTPIKQNANKARQNLSNSPEVAATNLLALFRRLLSRTKRSELIELETEEIEETPDETSETEEDEVEEVLIEEGMENGHLNSHKRVHFVPVSITTKHKKDKGDMPKHKKPMVLHVVEIVKEPSTAPTAGGAPPGGAPPGGAPPPPGGAPPPPGGAPPPPGGAPPPPGGAPPPAGGAPPPPPPG